jgi:hypothetical protein
MDEMIRRYQTQNVCRNLFTLTVAGLAFFFVTISPILQQVNTDNNHSI